MLSKSGLFITLCLALNGFAVGPIPDLKPDEISINLKSYVIKKRSVRTLEDLLRGDNDGDPKFGDWFNLDSKIDGVEGISVNKLYEEFGKPTKEIIVAVIDSGVDVNHEDLRERIWINEAEIPNNNIDDDENGYIDDFMGWNFIGTREGNGEFTEANGQWSFKSLRPDLQINEASYELHRLILKLRTHKESTTDTEQLVKINAKLSKLELEYKTDVENSKQNLAVIKRIMGSEQQIARYAEHFGVTEKELVTVTLPEAKEHFEGKLRNGKRFINEVEPLILVRDQEEKQYGVYGNNDIIGPDAFHGTHVSGIIAAKRDNEIGIDGIATNAKIMVIRAVPDGDERDKDVAKAIRYAVDNGAHIINMSFGKAHPSNTALVRAAYKHAQKHGVLLVHAAGNETKEVTKNNNYPTPFKNDTLGDFEKYSNSIQVGASAPLSAPDFRIDSHPLAADFSNYGKTGVDIFAPGVAIYSTIPYKTLGDGTIKKYAESDGTSMASPVVSGGLALLMGHFPDKSVGDIKATVMQTSNADRYKDVIIPYGQYMEAKIPFNDLSESGGIMNVYDAYQSLDK